MAEGVLKYTGCSLEVFEGVDSAELDYKKDSKLSGLMKIAKEQGETHIVRRTLVNRTVIATAISKDGLDHYLKSVDEVFASAARVVGGTVIEHEWGLVKRESAYTGNYYPAHLEGFGIPDYLLAARVPIVSGVPITTFYGEYYATFFNKLASAREEFAKEHGWFAYDTYKPDQFTIVTHPGDQQQILLHDIDPVTKDLHNDF